MLQSIRDHTQGWIAGTIISVLILSFALWGIHSYFVGGGNTDIVAKVNGKQILRNQVAIAYERLRRQMQAQVGPAAAASEKIELTLKKQALETVIDTEVLAQAASKQNYRISQQQVDSFLENIPDFQVNGQFSIARLEQVLMATHLSPPDFFQMVKTSLLIDQPRLGMIFTSFATPEEVVSTFSLVNQERDVRYAMLSLDAGKQAVQISPDQIQKYYKEHGNEFRTAEQVSIQYLQLSMDDMLSKIHPTDEALNSFYSDNVTSYSAPKQWKLEAIFIPVDGASSEKTKEAQSKIQEVYEKAKTGVSFAQLLQEFPTLKRVDEKLLTDWVSINQVYGDWQDAVLTLTQADQVAKPVKASQGFVILKALAFQDATIQPFEKVKDKVRASYIQQQAEEKFAELKEQLSNSTYEHPETLELTAKTLGLPIKKSDLFTKDQGAKDISENIKVREAAFSNDVLIQHSNSDLIQIDPNTILVLRVDSHVPAALLPLKSVEGQIVSILTEEALNAQSLRLAQEVLAQLKAGTPVDKVTQQYGLSWAHLGYTGRHAEHIDSMILDAAFSLPKLKNGAPQFAIAKVAKGYAIVAVDNIRDGNLDAANKDQYKIFAEQTQNAQGLLEYELYKESELSKAKIVISQ